MNRSQEKRLELGLTQPQVSARLKEVGARADVGMIPRYEKDVCLPAKDQFAALEELYGVPCTALCDVEDLDFLKFPRVEAPAEEGEHKATAPPPNHTGRFRKCYRIGREFAESPPDDLLQMYGYSSWQGWHDAALRGLLGGYAARSRNMRRKEDKTA